MGFGCGDVVGFVVKCVGFHVESSYFTANLTNPTHIPIPESHPRFGAVEGPSRISRDQASGIIDLFDNMEDEDGKVKERYIHFHVHV